MWWNCLLDLYNAHVCSWFSAALWWNCLLKVCNCHSDCKFATVTVICVDKRSCINVAVAYIILWCWSCCGEVVLWMKKLAIAVAFHNSCWCCFTTTASAFCPSWCCHWSYCCKAAEGAGKNAVAVLSCGLIACCKFATATASLQLSFLLIKEVALMLLLLISSFDAKAVVVK